EDIPEGIEDILMRALSKDRETRYQNARDMQFDIQEWLHGAEFAPSPAHMANFMKQIFIDEIEQEREALAAAANERRRRTPPPLPNVGSNSVEASDPGGAEVGEMVGRAKTPPEGNKGNGRAAALIVVDSEMRQRDANNNSGFDEAEHNVTIQLRGTELERLRA